MLARSIAEIDYSVSNVSIRISRCCDDRSGGRADGLAFRGRNEEALRKSEFGVDIEVQSNKIISLFGFNC